MSEINISVKGTKRLKTAGKYCADDIVVTALGGDTDIKIQSSKTVTPTKSQQTVTPDSGYDALSSVTVEKIPDSYIQPSGTKQIIANGEQDVREYEKVNVAVSSSVSLQEKTVTPTKSLQEVNPDSGFGGLSKVTVNPIPSSFVEPSGTKEITDNGTHNVKEYESVNVQIEQTAPVIEPLEITENGTYTAPNGVDGYSPITVNVASSGGGENKLAKVLNNTEEYEITASDLEGATTIKQYGFYAATKMKSIDIPESVTSIGNYAFHECSKLTSITFPNSVTSIGSSACYHCTGLKSVTIGNGVTSIGAWAFMACNRLTSITIGSGVTSISMQAFYNCTSMQYYDFTSHTTVPTLVNANAFSGIPTTCEIRVPMALVEEWKAATNWSTYASQIVGVDTNKMTISVDGETLNIEAENVYVEDDTLYINSDNAYVEGDTLYINS